MNHDEDYDDDFEEGFSAGYGGGFQVGRMDGIAEGRRQVALEDRIAAILRDHGYDSDDDGARCAKEIREELGL